MTRFKMMLAAILFVLSLNIFASEAKTPAGPWGKASFLYAFSSSWTPVQLSCFPVSLFHDKADVYGINIALWLGVLPQRVCGLSFSGIAAFVWEYHCGISVSGVWAVMGKNYGISIAPANMVADNSGIMLGLVNIGPMGDTEGSGLQIGLVNQAESGLQIGLINYNSNALIPWMPFLNGSWLAKKTTADTVPKE